DLRVTFDRRPAITEQTQMSLSPAQVSVLRAQASNSGIYVTGWDRSEYSVTTCKAVPDDDPNASATLREIVTTFSDGRISVDGPSHVSCSGSAWDGPGLEASARHGPLSIEIPDSYGSAIRIQASQHSPLSCRSSVCAQAVRSQTSPSIINIGNGEPLVRLSTV